VISREAFKPDCQEWDGSKPCPIQKVTGRPDCNGCDEYAPTAAIIDIEPSMYTPEALRSANHIGIIEMDGLGSILRTTAVSKAIRALNPEAKLIWFTSSRGSELLQYAPGVIPIDIDSMSTYEYEEVLPHLDVVVNFALREKAKSIVVSTENVAGFTLNAQDKFHGVSPYADTFQRLQIDDEFRKQNRLTMQEIILQSIGLENVECGYDRRHKLCHSR